MSQEGKLTATASALLEGSGMGRYARMLKEEFEKEFQEPSTTSPKPQRPQG